MKDWSVVLVGGVPVEGTRILGDWQMARALAQRREVLYVDPPLYPRTLLRDRDPSQLRRRIRRLGPNLSSARPVAPPGANRSWGVTLGDRLIGAQIERMAQGICGPRVILTFDPKRGSLPQVPRDLLVYWRRDRLASSAAASHPELLRNRDLELIQAADLVTGVSPPLVEEADSLGAVSELVPNGCDAAHFAAPTAMPPGFPSATPVIGFAGGVSWRLDVELLEHIAVARPDWTLLLVGEGSRELPDRPNILRVGVRPYEQLPGWVQRFDVGIIPYRQDSFNRAAAPLKVFEYLAAGVPVVSTTLPGIPPVPGLIASCDDAPAFIDAVESMLASPPAPGACYDLAAENDWNARASQLETFIEDRMASLPRR